MSKTCSRHQPTRFYDDNSKLNRSTLTLSEFKEASCNAAHAQEPASVVPIAPVRLRSGSRECEEPKYAMLNTCSTGSFVLEDIVDSLGIKGADTRLTEKTMNGRQFQDTKIQNGLVFQIWEAKIAFNCQRYLQVKTSPSEKICFPTKSSTNRNISRALLTIYHHRYLAPRLAFSSHKRTLKKIRSS